MDGFAGLNWFDFPEYLPKEDFVAKLSGFKINKFGRFTIHEAAKSGNYQVVKLLMECRWLKDKDDWTAVYYAEVNRHFKIVKLLLDTFDNRRKSLVDRFGETSFGYRQVVPMIKRYDLKQRTTQDVFPSSFLQI